MGDRKPETNRSSEDPSWKTEDWGNRSKERDNREGKSDEKGLSMMKGKSYRQKNNAKKTID